MMASLCCLLQDLKLKMPLAAKYVFFLPKTVVVNFLLNALFCDMVVVYCAELPAIKTQDLIISLKKVMYKRVWYPQQKKTAL